MIPSNFKPAYQALENLKNYSDFSGAFIFGSAARNELNLNSDIDAIVVVKKINHGCSEVSHPTIKGIKFDISFTKFEEIAKSYNCELKAREKIPTLAESIIVFDKTGQLTDLKNKAGKVKPISLKANDYYSIKYLAYHIVQEVKNLLEIDPKTSLLLMNRGVSDLLKLHYKISGEWWKSEKRVLNDLKKWDPSLESLIEHFLREPEIEKKYHILRSMVSQILDPIGGYCDISEIRSYHCRSCKRNLGFLQ